MKKASIFNQIKAILGPKTPKNEPYVLVARTGKKFHCDPDCPALRGARTSGMKLSEARKAGYTACDKCGV